MMAYGEEAHSNLFDGKSPDEIQQMRQMMDAHVRVSPHAVTQP